MTDTKLALDAIRIAAPTPIYTHGRALGCDDRAAHFRKLATVGIAALDSNMNLAHLDDALQGLFEVMHRLAGEIEDEIDQANTRAARAAAA